MSEIAKLGVSLTLSLLRTFDIGGPVLQCYRTYLARGFVILSYILVSLIPTGKPRSVIRGPGYVPRFRLPQRQESALFGLRRQEVGRK